MPEPRGFESEFAPRLRTHLNSLFTPVLTQTQTGPASRKTNRGTNIINYAEDLLADEDFDESDSPRRLTGLRSRNQPEPVSSRDILAERLSKELTEPEDLQGIWRDWMGKARYTKHYVEAGKPPLELLDIAAPDSEKPILRSEKQLLAQASLPLTLIPIRIDLEIAAFTPAPSFPLPPRYTEHGINPTTEAYRQHEPTLPYRLRDVFLWNLHEALVTPDEFAHTLANELDLPTPAYYASQISAQIRQQLEEYAGVAMHPLFHTTTAANGSSAVNGNADTPRGQSQTPALPATPITGTLSQVNGAPSPVKTTASVAARASPVPAAPSDVNNPDDMYRCIVTLNINLLNKLYTDRFEWSLLHPPGAAEAFAKQTCSDLGLGGEWVPVMTHAIYEAVLRLKKEACESGGLIGAGLGGEIDNFALPGYEAGWRYDDEGLGDEWEPKIEILSKDEIQKREDDRERQIRRQRRETARFSSTTNMNTSLTPAHNAGTPQGVGGYFDVPDADTPMGRGERSKKKRRFRSLSPVARANTPGGVSDAMGYGGLGGGPTEQEKWTWRCAHCEVWANSVWAIRDGPLRARSLCNNCGLVFEREKKLPQVLRSLHHSEVPIRPHR